MAAAIYLLTKAGSYQPEKLIIDDIHAMITNADDGDPDATKIAEAVATAVSLGHPLPTGYFDTVQKLGVETGGVMTTNEDAILILRRSTTESIA